MTDWEIKAEELANCNCNYGCPCQFSVLPSDGTCEAAVVYAIETGHYGETRLDGLHAAILYKWPGAIHEGNGEMQVVIDEGANDAQRDALEAILTGQDTAEMATVWFIFAAMAPNRHETLFAPIDANFDRETRTGKVVVGDIFDISAQPISHIVTGEPHRAGITLPNGFEFHAAEVASGTTHTRGSAISLGKNSETHAHFAALHLSGSGVIAA